MPAMIKSIGERLNSWVIPPSTTTSPVPVTVIEQVPASGEIGPEIVLFKVSVPASALIVAVPKRKIFPP